jgi:hypothetical protein
VTASELAAECRKLAEAIEARQKSPVERGADLGQGITRLEEAFGTDDYFTFKCEINHSGNGKTKVVWTAYRKSYWTDDRSTLAEAVNELLVHFDIEEGENSLETAQEALTPTVAEARLDELTAADQQHILPRDCAGTST